MAIAADKKKHLWAGALAGAAVTLFIAWFTAKFHHTWNTAFILPKFQYVRLNTEKIRLAF
jgi:hypothetical protein